MIKIQPSGDYVQLIYVDAVSQSVQEELKSDSDAIEYSSNPNGKIYLQFGRMTFEDIDPTEFEIDGIAVTDAADFITKLTALFSSPGGGVTIYTGDGSLTGDRIIDLNDHNLRIVYDIHDWLTMITTPGEENVVWIAWSSEINGAYAEIDAYANSDNGYRVSFSAFNQTNLVNLLLNADTGILTLTAPNGISTNGGTDKYLFGAASASAPTPDSKIRVTINGTDYDIAAQAV